jgi:hypothetical protein
VGRPCHNCLSPFRGFGFVRLRIQPRDGLYCSAATRLDSTRLSSTLLVYFSDAINCDTDSFRVAWHKTITAILVGGEASLKTGAYSLAAGFDEVSDVADLSAVLLRPA